MHRIKKAIQKSGRSQRWIAKQLGLSETYVSDIARGFRVPTEHHQAALACLLGVSINDLWPGATQ